MAFAGVSKHHSSGVSPNETANEAGEDEENFQKKSYSGPENIPGPEGVSKVAGSLGSAQGSAPLPAAVVAPEPPTHASARWARPPASVETWIQRSGRFCEATFLREVENNGLLRGSEDDSCGGRTALPSTKIRTEGLAVLRETDEVALLAEPFLQHLAPDFAGTCGTGGAGRQTQTHRARHPAGAGHRDRGREYARTSPRRMRRWRRTTPAE